MTKLCVNVLLGLGMQSLAESLALGERAGLPRARLLEAFAETSVLSPSQRSKFENIQRDEYPPAFPQRLMFKDLSLILQRALELAVACRRPPPRHKWLPRSTHASRRHTWTTICRRWSGRCGSRAGDRGNDASRRSVDVGRERDVERGAARLVVGRP
jgi:hypothetical protein